MTAKGKGKQSAKEAAAKVVDGKEESPVIASSKDLKDFLVTVRDKMTAQVAPPIYALGALRHVLTLANVYELLDSDNIEVAKDIWVRLKQSGLQLREPPILFGDSVEASAE